MNAKLSFHRIRIYSTRFLYSLTWCFVIPILLLRLRLRGKKEASYQHMAERIGFYPYIEKALISQNIIWIHAVSVGETRAAEPLISFILKKYPDHYILLTHMTPTGRATGKTLFGQSLRVLQSFIPYDVGWMINRFLHHFSPCLCILMETEIWPNLIITCKKHKIPVALVNARLSEKSLRRSKYFLALMTQVISNISCIGAQTTLDADRLIQLGGKNVQVTGNIKFDVNPSPALVEVGIDMRNLIGRRPVILFASTRDGEEKLIFEKILKYCHDVAYANLLFIVVPRHPQRFDQIVSLAKENNLPFLRRTNLNNRQLPSRIKILIGDSMGEMPAYYTACDVVFIGGSLLPMGGQNLIEAFSVGKSVLIGPHTFNFSDITEQAILAGAATRVDDATIMLEAACYLLENSPRRFLMNENASRFFLKNRGAVRYTTAMLTPFIQPR